MPNLMNYIWIVLLAVYIISPIDAVPSVFDDILAAIALFYFLNRNSKQKVQQQYYRQDDRSRSESYTPPGPGGELTLEKAYRRLGVDTDATLEDVSRAYKEKMRMSHPDKVSHLSEELQDRARELALELNEAYELIKKNKSW